MAFNPDSTTPSLFMPGLQDYLVTKLKLNKSRIRLDVGPTQEIKQADGGKTVALFLGGPVPYVSPNSGAGRHSEQLCRRLLVRVGTFNLGDDAGNRLRLLSNHWDFEEQVFNAIQKMSYIPEPFKFVCPPFMETSSPEPQHLKEVSGGVESSMTFVLTYIPRIEQGQP